MKSMFTDKVETVDSGRGRRAILTSRLKTTQTRVSKGFSFAEASSRVASGLENEDRIAVWCDDKNSLPRSVFTLTVPTFTKPSPVPSISTSPSTASASLRTLARRSVSSSCCVDTGAGSSLTSKMRRRLERATTMLKSVRPVCDEEPAWGRVDVVNLRHAACSTPLGGRIS